MAFMTLYCQFLTGGHGDFGSPFRRRRFVTNAIRQYSVQFSDTFNAILYTALNSLLLLYHPLLKTVTSEVEITNLCLGDLECVSKCITA